jgi:Flp pilus assembly protein CpaB
MLTQSPGGLGGNESTPTLRRTWWSRVSAGQVIMVLAALIAFVLNMNLVRSRDAVTTVAVAARTLAPGDQLVAGDVVFVDVNFDSTLAGALVAQDQIEGLYGKILTGPLAVGDPILRSFLVDTAELTDDLRGFSIPIEPEHAGGGLIRQGDLVDVISVVDGVATYVVTGARVISVPDTTERSLVGNTKYRVVVTVDSVQALRLAEALAADSVEVVRATGAPAPEVATLEDAAAGPTSAVSSETTVIGAG